MNNTSKIKLLICDDHALFREGIKAILRHEPEIEIVAEATNGKDGLLLAAKLQPDVVLMDIAMPDLSGYEAARRIKQAHKNIKVIILTMYDDEDLVARCLDAGASGYILKDTPAPQLVYAIQMVSKGGKYLSPEILKVMTDFSNAPRKPGPARAETRYDRLSDREREVLKLLAEGFTVKEIASRLDLSVKTVDVHKYNLMRKLDIHDRAALIRYAIQNKLVGLPLADQAYGGEEPRRKAK